MVPRKHGMWSGAHGIRRGGATDLVSKVLEVQVGQRLWTPDNLMEARVHELSDQVPLAPVGKPPPSTWRQQLSQAEQVGVRVLAQVRQQGELAQEPSHLALIFARAHSFDRDPLPVRFCLRVPGLDDDAEGAAPDGRHLREPLFQQEGHLVDTPSDHARFHSSDDRAQSRIFVRSQFDRLRLTDRPGTQRMKPPCVGRGLVGYR